MKRGFKPIHLNLKPEQHASISKLAKSEDRTVTSIIEEALTIYMKSKSKSPNKTSLFGGTLLDEGLSSPSKTTKSKHPKEYDDIFGNELVGEGFNDKEEREVW